MTLQSPMPYMSVEFEDMYKVIDIDVSALPGLDPSLPTGVSPQDMDLTELVDSCMRQIERFRRHEPSTDRYGLELFRRALMQNDSLAWEMVQTHFKGVLSGWMRNHPKRHVASRYDSDENYIAQAFARFWQATAGNQQIKFSTMAAILRYLQASLNGTILDTLRMYARPRELPLPEFNSAGEPIAEEHDDGNDLWEGIQSVLTDKQQQRVAYLLFHCHLKPREIVRFCPAEFPEVGEIYRIRHNIFTKLMRNAEYLRWKITAQLPQNPGQTSSKS